MKYLVILFILTLGLSNCQTTVIQINPGIELKNAVPEQKKRYGTVGFGYWEINKENISTCGQKVRKVVIQRDWLDCVIHTLIGGIYTSRTVDVYCGD